MAYIRPPLFGYWSHPKQKSKMSAPSDSSSEEVSSPKMRMSHALALQILAECSTTKARTCKLKLPHHTVDTPVFMPVGTQGTMKGMTTEQLEKLDCQLILGNTYHLGMRPVRTRSIYIKCRPINHVNLKG